MIFAKWQVRFTGQPSIVCASGEKKDAATQDYWTGWTAGARRYQPCRSVWASTYLGINERRRAARQDRGQTDDMRTVAPASRQKAAVATMTDKAPSHLVDTDRV